jgi:MFS transporter, SP family, arabinose:H+ symporter
MAFLLPESPRWLVRKGFHDKARQVLKRIFHEGSDEEFASIRDTISRESKATSRFADVFQPRFRKPLAIAMLLAAFAQFSGINVVFYYGTSMLETAGFQSDRALSGMTVIGAVNMLFTIIAMKYVDRLGRRLLLQIGTIGAIVCLTGIGLSFHSGASTLLIGPDVRFCRVLCVFARADQVHLRLGDLSPPTSARHAMALAILTMWATDTLVGQFTPLLRDGIGPSGTFLIFAVILLPQILMVWKWMPETAGRSLEDIEKDYRL